MQSGIILVHNDTVFEIGNDFDCSTLFASTLFLTLKNKSRLISKDIHRKSKKNNDVSKLCYISVHIFAKY